MLVSIVIPVYNGEKYIMRAIQSAQNQTLRALEIIVVDDFSSDLTAILVERCATEDPRVKLIRHESNRGILMARKTGTLHAKGRYVAYLDADDALIKNACEVLTTAMQTSDAQLIHFLAQYHYPEERKAMAGLDEIIACEDAGEGAWVGNRPGSELLERFFIHKQLHWSTWSMFCEADLVKHVFNLFGNERCDMAEDALTTFLLLVNAERVSYLNSRLYQYYIGIGITAEMNLRKARAVAYEYRVYTLLCECLTEEQKESIAIQAALTALHDELMDAVFWNLLHIEDEQIQNELTQTLLSCCPLSAFVKELQLYFSREGNRQTEALRAEWAAMRSEWNEAEKHYLSDISQLRTQMEEDRRGWERAEAHYQQDIGQLKWSADQLRQQSELEHQQWTANEENYLRSIAELKEAMENLQRQSVLEHQQWTANEENYLRSIAELKEAIEQLQRQSELEHQQWTANEEHYLRNIAELKAEIDRLRIARDELEHRLNMGPIAKIKARIEKRK